jgi:hypothetical protein
LTAQEEQFRIRQKNQVTEPAENGLAQLIMGPHPMKQDNNTLTYFRKETAARQEL